MSTEEEIKALGRRYARDSVAVADTKVQGRDSKGHFKNHVAALEPYKVYKTTDYGFFKKLKGNRHIREAHVRDLMESIKAHPSLAPAKPILINEKQEMIDGQHREEAYRRLSLPVYYEVVPKLTIVDARILNALQGDWRLVDYAYSYAESGVKEYRQLIELAEEAKLGVTVVVRFSLLSLKGDNSHRIGLEFKLGDYKPQPAEETREWLRKYQEFGEYFKIKPNYAKSKFADAVIRLFRNPEYNHARMITKLNRVGMINNWGITEEYLRELEDIYNKDNTTRTRFF